LTEIWDLLVADWFGRPLPVVTPRRARTAAIPGKADAVFGMRRSGKTSLLFGELAARVAAGVPREQALYVSMEDERLAGLQAADLGGLLDAWWRRYPALAEQECWLVLDEIQEVPGWESFVRRLLDRGGLRIAVTGSSARLLSREIATSLRGRSLGLEVLPFGFDEVLLHGGVDLPDRWPPAEGQRAQLQHAFDSYLHTGGFPEVLGLAEPERLRVLRDYVDVVLFRDVVERHGAGNIPALRRVVRRLAGGPGTMLSVHRFYNDLRSQGLGVGKDTLYAYFEQVEEAYLGFRVPVWSDSERVRASNPQKTYAIDPALARAYSPRSESGHLLENAVYLELRRRGGEISWLRTRSGFEVDFVVVRAEQALLVQVCWDPTELDVRERELRALSEAMEETGVREATIVSRLHREEVVMSAGVVRIVPAWTWFLGR